MKYKDFNYEVICINTFEIREYEIVVKDKGAEYPIEEIKVDNKKKKVILKTKNKKENK